MDTRAEHVRWCKQRALEHLDLGQPQLAVSSMISDMGKHPETEDAIRTQIVPGMATLKNEGAEGVRRWIEGFGE